MSEKNKKRQIFGFVGARKNSKGLPGKNNLKFNDKPLFLNALFKLKEAGIQKIIFSSDCTDMLAIAEQHGYMVDQRPKAFANDVTRIPEEILRLSRKYKLNEDFVISVPPTAPLIKVSSIQSALEKIYDGHNVDSCIATTDWQGPYPGLAFFSDHQGLLKNIGTELGIDTYPRQHRLSFKQNSGSFYIRNLTKMKSGHANESNNWLGQNIACQDITNYEAINIDTIKDWNAIMEHITK